MTKGKRKHIAFALAVAAVLALLFGARLHRRSAAAARPLPPPAPRVDCDHLKFLTEPPHYIPSAAESNELGMAFRRVAEAYASGDVAALRRRIAEMPPLATNVADFVCFALVKPFLCSFDDRFLSSCETSDFSSADEFSQFVRLNVETARFLGDLCLRRGAYSVTLIRLDNCVLRRLLQYRDRFRREGRKDMEARAEEFVAEWEALIESPGGFTRNYMRRQIALQHAHIEEGSLTHGQLFKILRRQFATGLLKAGYKPKWLDEEFPLLEKEKPRDGEGSRKRF